MRSTLSREALRVIDEYVHFRLGSAVCSVPYLNNKTKKARANLAVNVGKGSPKEIHDEAVSLAFKEHIDTNQLPDEALKKFLTENNLGIDCSGFAYHVLNAECESRIHTTLNRKLHFTHSRGIVGKFVQLMNPSKNVDVLTFTDNSNSQMIEIADIQAGDIITMLNSNDSGERNHILVVHEVDRNNDTSIIIHYSHAASDPEDGVYGSGVKQGTIELQSTMNSILQGVWSEGGSIEGAKRIFERANKSKTEIRRLMWL